MNMNKMKIKSGAMKLVNTDMLVKTYWRSARMLRHLLSQLAKKKQTQKFLATLSNEDVIKLKYLWPVWAGHKQYAVPAEWTNWLMLGGRGAGKTRPGLNGYAAWCRVTRCIPLLQLVGLLSALISLSEQAMAYFAGKEDA